MFKQLINKLFPKRKPITVKRNSRYLTIKAEEPYAEQIWQQLKNKSTGEVENE